MFFGKLGVLGFFAKKTGILWPVGCFWTVSGTFLSKSEFAGLQNSRITWEQERNKVDIYEFLLSPLRGTVIAKITVKIMLEISENQFYPFHPCSQLASRSEATKMSNLFNLRPIDTDLKVKLHLTSCTPPIFSRGNKHPGVHLPSFSRFASKRYQNNLMQASERMIDGQRGEPRSPD
jgi:hypothetical protein